MNEDEFDLVGIQKEFEEALGQDYPKMQQMVKLSAHAAHQDGRLFVACDRFAVVINHKNKQALEESVWKIADTAKRNLRAGAHRSDRTNANLVMHFLESFFLKPN